MTSHQASGVGLRGLVKYQREFGVFLFLGATLGDSSYHGSFFLRPQSLRPRWREEPTLPGEILGPVQFLTGMSAVFG